MTRATLRLLISLPGLSLACAGSAVAQTTPAPFAHTPVRAPVLRAQHRAAAPAKPVAETINVTGRSRHALRHERLQQTAQSISELSAAKLERLSIRSTREIANLTPNLYQPRATVGYSNSNYFIRGIGELDPQGEPSVGTYIDGIYIPRTIGTMQELLDIDAIEVDRGPVGFTEGHQAEGGAVRIDTVVPTDQKHFAAQAGYGTYNEWSVGAAASGALVPGKVFASIAVSHHNRDGVDRNTTLDTDENNINYTQGRGKLRLTPSEKLDVTLAFDGTADGSLNRGYGSLLVPNSTTLHSSIYPKNNYSEAGFTGTAIYHLTDHVDLRSLTGVRGYDDKGVYDNTGDPYARTSQPLYYRDRAYSQELRATAHWDRLTMTGGVYGFYEDWLTQRRANNVSTYTINPRNTIYQPLYTSIDQLNRDVAAFGQVQYRITPTLTFTAGLRWNHEQHSNSQILQYLGTNVAHTASVANDRTVLFDNAPGATAWTAAAHGTWEQLLPKGSIDWAARPDVRLYATISQGGKSGGYDFRAQTPTATGRQQAILPYRPETVTTYEIGAKTEPLHGLITLNSDLFYNSFRDLQITTADPATGLSHRFNAGNGHSYGAEIEGHLRLTKALEIDLTGSYLFSELDTFAGVYAFSRFANGTFVNSTPHVGERLPYSPRFQGDIAVDYTLPHRWTRLVPGTFRVGGDVSYQSALFTDALENTQTRLPDQTFINALAGWTSPDTRWAATLTAKNLADRRFPQSLSFVQAQGAPLIWAASFNDPRTVFFTIRYKY